MPTPAEDKVLETLRKIADPLRGGDIVSAGRLSGLVVRDRNVAFAIEIEASEAQRMEPVRKAAERAIEALPDIASVSAVLTAHRARPGAPPQPAHNHDHGHAHDHGHSHAPAAAPKPAAGPAKQGVPGVKHIIAVASGKGGVGKSTTAVNLALALHGLGLSVGLMDADIYGPSQPRLMGLSGRPRVTDDKKMIPPENFGIRVISMGFLVEEDTPMIWRGPMVMGAVTQLLREVAWGETDVLVCDMPPGTGDAQLTMAQSVPLSGAVIVSTPQDIALIDARKAIGMFNRVDVPVLGIVENMSYFNCPHCGGRTDIFAHGGAKAEAARYKVDFLGEVPLDIAIRETSDAGTPIVASQPQSPHSAAYRKIAEAVWAKLQAGTGRQAPRIVMK